MTWYIDTSVLVAYYFPEPLSECVESFLTACVQPAISRLTEVEFCSALSKRIRMGDMKKTDADQLTALFFNHVSSGFYRRLAMEDEHFRIAREWIASWGTALKSLDALHLAIAASGGFTIATADKQLSVVAETLSVKVLLMENTDA